eukprot:5990775-Prymnesium_polylepis.1
MLVGASLGGGAARALLNLAAASPAALGALRVTSVATRTRGPRCTCRAPPHAHPRRALPALPPA